MDIRCPKCGEPWDHDELHEMYIGDRHLSYKDAARRFRRLGCEAFDSQHNEPADEEKAEVAAALYEALGDDMDGAAAMMEDYGL